MSNNKTQSTVAPTYRGSVQLQLDNRAATLTEVCLVKVQPGTKGDLIGRLKSGKVVILSERNQWVEGYALVELTEEREKVAFGKKAVFCIKPQPGSPFAVEFHPQPPTNFSATSADQFLDEFRVLLSNAVDFFEKTEMECRAEQSAALAEKKAQVELGRELADDAGVALVVALQSHDWHYSYSDDGRLWQKGEEGWKAIKKMVSELDPAAARSIWDRIAPKDFAFPA